MSVPLPAPSRPQPPSPLDRLDWRWATVWILWGLFFVVAETLALRADAASPDRVKRTLSSNTRYATAWDTLTGMPLEVRFGKLRRLAFVLLVAWFPIHITRPGSV